MLKFDDLGRRGDLGGIRGNGSVGKRRLGSWSWVPLWLMSWRGFG